MNKRLRKITWLALLAAIGTLLFMVEAVIPRPLPWLKPGLANMTTLTALYLFGLPEALIVAVMRIFIGSLFTGSFMNPAFLLSISGSLVATLIMGACIRYCPHFFSIIGISVLGATMHNVVQLIIASLLFVGHIQLFYLFPLISLSALLTGVLVALSTHMMLVYIHKHLLAF